MATFNVPVLGNVSVEADSEKQAVRIVEKCLFGGSSAISAEEILASLEVDTTGSLSNRLTNKPTNQKTPTMKVQIRVCEIAERVGYCWVEVPEGTERFDVPRLVRNEIGYNVDEWYASATIETLSVSVV